MFNFSSGGLDFGRSGGSGKRTEYLLVGGLALVIVCSLGFTIWHIFMPGGSTVEIPKEYHMFCVNCSKEVIIPSGQRSGAPNVTGISAAGPTAGPAAGPSAGPVTPPAAESRFGICPICGKAALIYERQCPKCKHYYVTEWDKTQHGTLEVDPQSDTFKCPNCGVVIEEYRKSHPYGN